MSAALCAGLLGVFAAPAAAQDVAVTGGVDFSNRYNFRGIRQNAGEVSIWPFVDVGIPLASGDGALKSVTLNLGTWNAFHTEIDEATFVNRDGDATGNKWYESDLYATLGLGFGTTTLGFTYTSYMSPANLWHNVQELAVKGFLQRDRAAVHQACLVDPLASASVSLADIRKMVDELFEANARWLDGWEASATGSARRDVERAPMQGAPVSP